MKNKKELWNVCLEVYEKMYEKALPKANFKKLMEEGITKKPRWFMKYFLDIKQQERIIDEICDKHKLDKHEKRKVSQEIHLGCAPNSSKKT